MTPARRPLPHGSSPDFWCCLGSEVGGAREELGFAAAAPTGTGHNLTAERVSLPACWLSPHCSLPNPSLFSHSKLVLMAPYAASAIGVTALINNLPSWGGQARLLTANSQTATAAMRGGEVAMPMGFVLALLLFPPWDCSSPMLALGEGAVGRCVRAGDGCGGQRGRVRARAARRGLVPLSGAAASPALAPSRFHVSDFKGSGLRGSFIQMKP